MLFGCLTVCLLIVELVGWLIDARCFFDGMFENERWGAPTAPSPSLFASLLHCAHQVASATLARSTGPWPEKATAIFGRRVDVFVQSTRCHLSITHVSEESSCEGRVAQVMRLRYLKRGQKRRRGEKGRKGGEGGEGEREWRKNGE